MISSFWQGNVSAAGQPGDTFVLTDTTIVYTPGQHEIFSYADTSNFVFAEDDEIDNIFSTVFTATCTLGTTSDTFDSAISGDWTFRRYNTGFTQGTASIVSSQLRIESDGYSTAGNNDDASNRGHALLHRTNPISSSAGLDVVVQILDAPTTANFAKGGLQIRSDPDDARSAKVEFDLAYNNSNGLHRLQVAARDPRDTNAGSILTSDTVDLSSGPVWLRIERMPGSDVFNFYYLQQANQPATNADWGSPYVSASIALPDLVYVGLFNASYSNNNNDDTIFDNFSISDPTACNAAVPAETFPPGITICTDLLTETGFETVPTAAWILPVSENVTLFPGGIEANTGNFILQAPTFDGSFNTPYFYQEFVMPSWVVSSTTSFTLNFYNQVRKDNGIADDPNDEFFCRRLNVTGSSNWP